MDEEIENLWKIIMKNMVEDKNLEKLRNAPYVREPNDIRIHYDKIAEAEWSYIDDVLDTINDKLLVYAGKAKHICLDKTEAAKDADLDLLDT